MTAEQGTSTREPGRPAGEAAPRGWDAWLPTRRRLAGVDVLRAWLLTRGLALLLLTFEYAPVTGDLRYYFRSTGPLVEGTADLGEVMVEYPVLCVLFTAALRVVAGIQQDVYSASFLLLMIGADALVTRVLVRAGRSRSTGSTESRRTGLWLWLWFAPALGPLLYARLDLLPAALAGAAVLTALTGYRRSSSGLSGVLAGLGCLVKLFPLIVMPALVLRRGGRLGLVAGFVATVVAGVGLTYLAVGPERLASPVTWQQDRGLQLEAVPALPLLLASVFRPGTWWTEYSDHLAVEVFGPGVPAMMTAATIATGIAVGILAVLWFRGLRPTALDPAAVAWLVVATVCLVLVTNKVFSPQYLVWLAAALAALGTVADEAEVWRIGRLFLLVCVLTQGFYPTLYRFLTALEPVMVALILARDLVLLVVAGLAVRAVWVHTRRTRAVVAARA